MNLIEDLKARGLVEHHSGDLEKIFETKRTLYIGTDPTADSLHVGHLFWLLLLKRLGAAGHSLIVLVGGGTGMIGDPREAGERVLLDDGILRKNTKALQTQIKSVLGNLRFRMVDNADWLKKVSLVDFLRDTGKFFTVNDLIKRDLIKRRLDTPNESISYTEFSYSLLQAYDYRVLNQKYGCDLQLGASDQWTNILSGVDLIRKKDGKEVFALAIPLVTDSNGKKFGKSEGNAVWLDAKKTSPFSFYQFWLNQPDDVVEKYLKFYTFLPVVELDAIMELHKRNPERRVAQRKLADEVTSTVHGEKETEHARKITEVQFGGASIDSLTSEERMAFEAATPTYSISTGENTIVAALLGSGVVSSKSEVRRLIDNKGIKLNGETVDTDRAFVDSDFTNGFALLQKGKTEKIRVTK